jgi:hypothetical protein
MGLRVLLIAGLLGTAMGFFVFRSHGSPVLDDSRTNTLTAH